MQNEQIFHGVGRGYLLVGDLEEARDFAIKAIVELLNCQSGNLKSHPDFSVFDGSLFSIDDARKIRQASSKKSFSGKGRVFLLRANFFSKEACNALLKTFEEPVALCCFFIIARSLADIPVTLRSRMVILKFRRQPSSEERQNAALKFLKAAPSSRMKSIKNLTREKEELLEFLDDLETRLEGVFRQNLASRELIFSLEELDKQRRRLYGRAPALKMILEHLCLVLPKI